MKKQQTRNSSWIIMAILLVSYVISASVFLHRSTIVVADDDEHEEEREDDEHDEDDEDDEDDEHDEDDEDDERSGGGSVEENTYIDVSQSTTTTIYGDKDGDGIIDNEDPHPDIAEVYIVNDDDRNGIVDSFEREER